MNYAGLPKQVAIKTLQPPTPSHILFMPLRCLILLEFFFFFPFWTLLLLWKRELVEVVPGYLLREIQGKSVIFGVLQFNLFEEITMVLGGGEPISSITSQPLQNPTASLDGRKGMCGKKPILQMVKQRYQRHLSASRVASRPHGKRRKRAKRVCRLGACLSMVLHKPKLMACFW